MSISGGECETELRAGCGSDLVGSWLIGGSVKRQPRDRVRVASQLRPGAEWVGL